MNEPRAVSRGAGDVTRGVQRGQLVGCVPGRDQDLVGVLAQLRPRRASGVAGGPAELDRDPQQLDRALRPRLGELHHHLPRGHQL